MTKINYYQETHIFLKFSFILLLFAFVKVLKLCKVVALDIQSGDGGCWLYINI